MADWPKLGPVAPGITATTHSYYNLSFVQLHNTNTLVSCGALTCPRPIFHCTPLTQQYLYLIHRPRPPLPLLLHPPAWLSFARSCCKACCGREQATQVRERHWEDPLAGTCAACLEQPWRDIAIGRRATRSRQSGCWDRQLHSLHPAMTLLELVRTDAGTMVAGSYRRCRDYGTSVVESCNHRQRCWKLPCAKLRRWAKK